MHQPQLQLFDLDHLVQKLSTLFPSEEEIRLEAFQHRNPRRNPFLHPLNTARIQVEENLLDKQVLLQGKYPLYLIGAPSGISALWDLDSESRVGYVFVRQIAHDSTSSYGGISESLTLRLKHPLTLSSGTLPPLTIKLYEEREDDSSTSVRQDYRPLFSLGSLRAGWKKTDFSKRIPTEWFYPKSASNTMNASSYASSRA